MQPVKNDIKIEKIAIYTMITPDFSLLGYVRRVLNLPGRYDVPRIISNRQRYCDKWNITHVVQTAWKSGRHPVWQKIYDGELLLQKFDAVWLLDADAFIMNGEISLKRLINQYNLQTEYNSDIIIGKGCNNFGFNAGSFILKNSKWTNMFLKKWKAIEYNDSFPDALKLREQAALQYLYNNNAADIKKHLFEAPQRDINSYAGYCTEYQKGDFVVHSPGKGYRNGLETYVLKMNLTEF